MKKIILILSLLLLTGCYDYKEINDLGIVSGIGIDYQDNEYIITLEVLNQKTDKESDTISTYLKIGTGKSITEALENAASKMEVEANYTHVKLMVLSESITKEKFKSIIDFFLRSTHFRENFYTITSLEYTPEEIFKNTSKESPVASTNITKSLENNKYATNNGVLKTFDRMIEEIITFGIDTSISNISIDNDSNFYVNGLSIFHDYDYIETISNDYAIIFNILNNEFYRPIFTKEFNNTYFSISLLSGKVDINIDDNTIYIKGTIEGKIMDNEQEFNVKDINTLNYLNNEFTNLLNDKFTEFLKYIQKNESDILGISKIYYTNTRDKNSNAWLNMNINSNIKFLINKKGLIYDVKEELQS